MIMLFSYILTVSLWIPAYSAPNQQALNKILVPGNPDTVMNRENVRNILEEAYKDRIPRLQGRQPVLPTSFITRVNNNGPRNNRTKDKFEAVNKEIEDYTFESDIMLNEKQARIVAEAIKNGNYRTKRQAIVESAYFWDTNTPIYYQFDSKLSSTNIANVRKAIQFWNDNSCLSFKENSTAKNRLYLTAAGGCWSYVGKQSESEYQVVSVGPGCDMLGTATHELAHAIGFWHQQSRFDRDDYVFVDFSNIVPSQQYNFQKMPVTQAQLLGLPYDYGSVMQYYPYAFALNSSQYTILARDFAYQNSMGQRESPAFSDIRAINKLYNCTQKCTRRLSCSNCGFTDPRSCNQCKCPHYFTGQYCNDLPVGNALTCNGQIISATSSSWTRFDAFAGDPDNYSTTNTTNCYWHIKAPIGYQISFRLVAAPMAAICMQECPWQSVEINFGKFDLYGIITCCDTMLNQLFTSESNMIAMRGIIRYNQIKFSIEYRIVPSNSSNSSSSSCNNQL